MPQRGWKRPPGRERGWPAQENLDLARTLRPLRRIGTNRAYTGTSHTGYPVLPDRVFRTGLGRFDAAPGQMAWFGMVDALAQKSPSRIDPLLLDNQLCYALYAAAHRMTKSYRPMLERLGLTYPQYLVLLVLWETDGITVSEIGRRLRLDSGTLTPVLKRLEAAGFLVRSRRRTDEREVEIALTPHGQGLRSEATALRESVMCQLNMSEPEIQAMRADLNALIENLSTAS